MLLVVTPDEVLDGEVSTQRCPEELDDCEGNVGVEERLDTGPGVWLLLRGFNPDPPSGAVEEQGEVDRAGEAEEAESDSEVISSQLILRTLTM